MLLRADNHVSIISTALQSSNPTALKAPYLPRVCLFLAFTPNKCLSTIQLIDVKRHWLIDTARYQLIDTARVYLGVRQGECVRRPNEQNEGNKQRDRRYRLIITSNSFPSLRFILDPLEYLPFVWLSIWYIRLWNIQELIKFKMN